ncbi:phosphatidylinositol phosphatase PTPRQ-like [Sycon ciliatum]|uniref:phosphatidylinositol phosphatase PTPRQ-like n=1 Tax=Sycon ciliatum TaxID=27933 RepID=UPI0031F70A5C
MVVHCEVLFVAVCILLLGPRAGHSQFSQSPDLTVKSFWHCRCTDVTYELVGYQLSDPTSTWDEEVRDHENAYGDCADNDFGLPEVGLYDHECLRDFHTFLVNHYQIAADTRIWMRGAHFAKGTECSVFDGSQVISNYNCSWPNAYVCQGEDPQKMPFDSFDEAPAAPDVEITPADTVVYVAFVNDTACHENCVTVTTTNQTGTFSTEVCSSHSIVPVPQLKKQATYTITAFTKAIRQSSFLLSNRTSPVTVTTLSAVTSPQPSPPSGVTIDAAFARALQISWIAPSSPAIVAYDVTAEGTSPLFSHTDHIGKIAPGRSVTGTILGDLVPYTNYTVTVSVITTAGQSQLSSSVSMFTLEDAPSAGPDIVGAHANSSTSVNIRWTPVPPELRNGVIIGYYVLAEALNVDSEHLYEIRDGDALEFHIPNLITYQDYLFAVSAVTSAGASHWGQHIFMNVDPNDPPYVRPTTSAPTLPSPTTPPPTTESPMQYMTSMADSTDEDQKTREPDSTTGSDPGEEESPEEQSTSLSTGASIGIGLGLAAVAIALILLAFVLYIRRNQPGPARSSGNDDGGMDTFAAAGVPYDGLNDSVENPVYGADEA